MAEPPGGRAALAVDDPAVRAVLAARAAALAAPRAVVGERPVEPLVVLTVGERRYAVPAGRVRRVLPPGPTTGLPGAGHHLAGARAVGRELLVLADIARLTGGAGVADPDRAYVVVLAGAEPLGLLAEAVTTAQAVDPSSDVPRGSGVVRGVSRAGLVHLDVDRLLADPRLRVAPPPSRPTIPRSP